MPRSSNRSNGVRPTRRNSYAFTLFSYSDEDIARFRALTESPGEDQQPAARYIVFQEEITPLTNVPHLQGYIELLRPYSMRSAKRIFANNSIHLEFRRGTSKQASDYCKKHETRKPGTEPFESGTRARQNELYVTAVDAVVGGSTLTSIAHSHPTEYVRHYRGLAALKEKLTQPRNFKPEVYIFYGPTGSGKTYDAAAFPDVHFIPWPTGGRWWWPGYDGQETIILDEFRHQIRLDVMLRLIDRYAFPIEFKGGHRQLTSLRIVITSNVAPKDWYPNVPQGYLEPLYRRFREFAKIYRYRLPLGRDPQGLPVHSRLLVDYLGVAITEEEEDGETSDAESAVLWTDTRGAANHNFIIDVPFLDDDDDEDEEENPFELE